LQWRLTELRVADGGEAGSTISEGHEVFLEAKSRTRMSRGVKRTSFRCASKSKTGRKRAAGATPKELDDDAEYEGTNEGARITVLKIEEEMELRYQDVERRNQNSVIGRVETKGHDLGARPKGLAKIGPWVRENRLCMESSWTNRRALIGCLSAVSARAKVSVSRSLSCATFQSLSAIRCQPTFRCAAHSAVLAGAGGFGHRPLTARQADRAHPA
jgi:hypothetical protein